MGNKISWELQYSLKNEVRAPILWDRVYYGSSILTTTEKQHFVLVHWYFIVKLPSRFWSSDCCFFIIFHQLKWPVLAIQCLILHIKYMNYDCISCFGSCSIFVWWKWPHNMLQFDRNYPATPTLHHTSHICQYKHLSSPAGHLATDTYTRKFLFRNSY